MAGRSRTLAIEIVGDAKGLSGAFNEAERKADGFGRGMASAGRAGALAFAGVAAGAVAATVVLAKWSSAAVDDAAEQALYEKQILLAGGSAAVIEGFDEQIAAGHEGGGITCEVEGGACDLLGTPDASQEMLRPHHRAPCSRRCCR